MFGAVVLLVAVGALTAYPREGSSQAPDAPAARAASSATATAPRVVIARAVNPAQPRAQAAAVASSPVSLRIPAIDLAASVDALGLNPDDTIEVPDTPGRAGWYRLGPSPGQTGSAVIVGHVDSKTGPAVFYRLKSLQPGDNIAVTLADGSVARFVVRRVATYLNAAFPARRVYGSRGVAALQLVTCGGKYDRRTQSYTANVVAFTRLVSVTPRPQAMPPKQRCTGPGC